MTPQETHLQSMLDQLRTRLLVMCVTVEKVVADACTVLCEGDAKLANAVIDADSGIDELENEVDAMALSLMARSQPVARDLRFVVSALRMVIDLERIGDEAAAIAERALLLRATPDLPAFALMRRMMDMAQSALHDAIAAFRDEDVPLALQICQDKNDIMQLEVHLLQDVMRDLSGTTSGMDAAGWSTLHTILIARSISRIFGRASNIAEHCYFMKQGVSIKHTKTDHVLNARSIIVSDRVSHNKTTAVLMPGASCRTRQELVSCRPLQHTHARRRVMKMTFRWYGASDPIPLRHIRQIPGMSGVVSAVYDVPVGEVWPTETIRALKSEAEAHALTLEVIESVPVHEDIKLGKPSRDGLIDRYCQTIRNLGACGIKVVCYNFMPVFDWTRTSLAMELPDGSTTLSFDTEAVNTMDLSRGLSLPGWDSSYQPGELKILLNEYAGVNEEKLWSHLEYFLHRIIPVAEASGVKMAIHPDDPPRPIFGLPRIVKNRQDLERLTALAPSRHNGLTLCSGSLGADPRNDLEELVRHFSGRGLIHFAHMRNVKTRANGDFYESGHLSSEGSLDMAALMRAYYESGFDGYMRPDHGRMIWGETGKPGYGLYDRALGAVYLNGLWEGITKAKQA